MNVLKSALRELTVDDHKSLALANSLLKRDQHDPEVLERLNSEPQKVVSDLEEFRAHVTDPSTMRICVGGDVTSLSEPKTVWAKHFAASQVSQMTMYCRPGG